MYYQKIVFTLILCLYGGLSFAQDCLECKDIYASQGNVPSGTICQPSFSGDTPGGLTCLNNEKCIEVGKAFLVNPPETLYIFSWGDGTIDTLTHQQLLNIPADGGIFGDQRLVCHPYKSVTCPDPNLVFPVSVNVLNPNGDCTNSIAAGEIRVLEPLIADFTTNDVVCTNESFSIINQSQEGYNSDCTRDAEYQWDFNNDGTIDLTTTGLGAPVTHPGFATPGVKKIRLLGYQNPRNVCGPDEIIKEVTVLSVPKAKFDIGAGSDLLSVENCSDELEFTFSKPADACAELSLPLLNTTEDVNPTTVFEWVVSSPDGVASFASKDHNLLNNTITFSKAGQYKLSLKVTDNCADGLSGSSIACVNISVKDSPDLQIDSPGPICEGSELIAAALNGSTPIDMSDVSKLEWQLTDSDGNLLSIPENGKDTLQIAGMAAGSYTLNLSYENSCGALNAEPLTLEVNPAPVITLSADKLTVCTNEEFTITADDEAATAYEWFLNDTQIPGEQSASLSTSHSTAGEYVYHISAQQGGCIIKSETVTIRVVSPATSDAIVANQSVFCEGETVAFRLEAPNIQPTTASKQWQSCSLCDGSDWADIDGANNATYEGSAPGSYRLALSLEGSCTSFSEAIDISVRPLPDWRPSISLPEVCAGESISLSLQGNAEKYIWSPAIGLSATEGSTISIQPEADTEYTITAISGSCERDTTLTVKVLEKPEIQASASKVLICPGDTVILQASGGSTYTWLEHPSLEQMTDGQALAFPTESTTFQVVGFNDQACADTATLSIEVRSIPGLSAEDETVCISDPPFALSLSLPEGISGSWSAPQLPDGSLTPEGIFNPALAGLSTEGHTLTFTFITDDALACASSFTKRVIVSPLPEPAFSVPPVVCVNEAVEFSNQTEGNYSYRWKVENSSYAEESPTHSFQAVASEAVIWLYAETTSGCIDSTSQKVQVVAAPKAAFSTSVAPASLCGPLTATFTNESQGELLSYHWDFGNGESSEEQEPPPVTFAPSMLGDTSYVVKLEVSNACTSVAFTDTVWVKPPPVANFLFARDTVCAGYPLNINNYSAGSSTEFEWYFGFDNTRPPKLSYTAETFSQAFPYEGTTDTTYYVTLVAKNMCGTDTLTRPLVVTPNTVEAFYHNNSIQGCGPLEVTLTSNQIAASGNQITYIWGDGDTTRAEIAATHVYRTPGTYYPKLIVQNGCSIDTCGGPEDPDCGSVIQVYPSPTASFSAPERICAGDTLELSNTSSHAVNSEWDFGDGRTHQGTTPPAFTYTQSGTYTISLTTANPQGCTSETFSRQIEVMPLPVASFEVSEEAYCQADVISISNMSSGASHFEWRASGLGVISTERELNYTFTQAGTYALSLTAYTNSSEEACTDQLSKTIYISQPAEPYFSISRSSACQGNSITFDNLTSYPGEEGNYYWDFGNGNTYNGSGQVPAQLYPYPENGTSSYTISLSVSAEGCTQTYTQEVKVASFVGVVRPEGNKPLAFSPTASTNNSFRLNYQQLSDIDLRIYSREGIEVFKTDDPNQSWDGYYRGSLAPAGLYNVQVSYTNCAGRSGNEVLQLYLLLDEF